jgi:hypothetical protein
MGDVVQKKWRHPANRCRHNVSLNEQLLDMEKRLFRFFRTMFERLPCKRFRDTPSVRFFDVTVETSNARDLVTHAGPAVSPPDDPETGAWQFYLHPHQEDNLLAASGGRTFYLVNLSWTKPFHIVRLESGGDILRIPPGTFHRSISDPDGSVVLNQAVRETGVSLVREFRVYNSARIPALHAATVITAPKPVLHATQPVAHAA